MTEQTFQLTTQYKYAVLRVFGFGAIVLCLMMATTVMLNNIFPDNWMYGVFILLVIGAIFFLKRYTHSIGKYEVSILVSEAGMSIAPLYEDHLAILNPWTAMEDFRLIATRYDDVLYIRWHDGKSSHFSGMEVDTFYNFLLENFPKKEWRFLGAPGK